MKIEEIRRLSKSELQAKANQYLAEIETVTVEQQATLFSKVDLYVRELERRRDHNVASRDLILELVIIALICGEVLLGIQQERQQSNNFRDQQQILQNLTSSSQATADILASLKSTTEAMNGTTLQELNAMKSAAGSSARSAKASEASAETAVKSLHLSERAYVASGIAMSGPLKVAEAQRFTVSIRNVGKTPATDVRVLTRSVSVFRAAEKEEAIAYNQAQKFHDNGQPTNTILIPEQQVEQILENPPADKAFVTEVEADRMRIYIFVIIDYKDLFDHQHRTMTCSLYNPHMQKLIGCAALNIAD